MNLSGLLSALTETDVFQSILTAVRKGEAVPDQDILRSARPFVAAALASLCERPVLIVAPSDDRAYNIAEQIPVWMPDAIISRFHDPTPAFYERAPWSDHAIHSRLQTLGLLATREAGDPCPIVVTSARALMQKTLPMREFRAGSRKLRVKGEHDPEKLLRLWLELGYEPTTVVTQPGQFSRRGGIVDLYPSTAPMPVRIEFWGDEIESLRQFDPATQRSHDNLESLTFYPTREALPKYAPQVAEKLKTWFENQPTEDDAVSARPDQEALAQGTSFPLLEYYLPWMYSDPATLIDYLPEDAVVLVDDWGGLRDRMEEIEEEALEFRADKVARNQLPSNAPLAYHTWDHLYEALETRTPVHLGRGESPPTEQVVGSLFQPDQRFGGQLRRFIEYLGQLKRQAETSLTVTRQAQHIEELWSESNDPVRTVEDITSLAALRSTNFIEGELTEGWLLQSDQPRRRIHLLTDSEIFGWKRPEPRRRQRRRSVAPEAQFADLEIGDYVVHIEQGIARFGGLIKRQYGDEEREFLKLEYAEGDMIFVPIHQAERITRYIGPDDAAPKLNRVGTQEWTRIREKASEAAEEVAREMLELYAKRAVAKGHAFRPDAPWQHELEASFPYVETEDQLRAIQEVKQDMESPQPMDRLVCGDVGYGKTEVALRAAFKATMDGKQVAVLVPTTILAQQHYNTFSKRLVNFPVRVELISRFRSPEEQKEVTKGLKDGTVDIVVGTHRLLSEDVQFKDLGLLIIDEEQRFGITHKEKLKKMRSNVDILTLTATPIPRTLYMSMTGIRDISVIQTAPEERLPVATHVGSFDERLVRQAILRELDRGGQVFFVHNRVQSIKSVAELVQNLVPEAKIAVAHGQMNEHRLEQIMSDFTYGEYDVLLSTSIIESGLDIPNANTIIIDRADWFGLAELYQLRGRVGRSAQQAYAYFFHPSTQRLTEEARARLETISEETQLGAGLSIAMRDLELRGAGDMLGKRQSGHIAAVGFQLYTQMLAQAVRKMKRQAGIVETKLKELPPPPMTIDLPIPSYIPSDYIPETPLRIQLYRRLADLQSPEAVEEIGTEMEDRFGPCPRAVEGLLYQLRVKLLAARAHATGIITDGDKIGIRLPYLAHVDRAGLQKELGKEVRVSRTAIWLPRREEDEAWQKLLVETLEKLVRLEPDTEMEGL